MQAAMFKGRDALVSRLDQAVQKGSVEEITAAVQKSLEELISGGLLELQAETMQCCESSYARRLLYKSEEFGYTVIAMVWGPGQGTALHDHSGVWCVEGVLLGAIRVTQFELVEQRQGLFRFKPQDTLESEIGSAGSLIPPYEYHTIANSLPVQPSITLHVYGEELNQCSIFEPNQQGWYVPQKRPLTYN